MTLTLLFSMGAFAIGFVAGIVAVEHMAREGRTLTVDRESLLGRWIARVLGW